MKRLVFVFAVLFLLTACQVNFQNDLEPQTSATNISGSSSGGPAEGVK